MSIRNAFSEHIILPISDLLTGECVSRNLKFLLKSKDWSDNLIVQFQVDRMKMLVDHISTQVPFYRGYFIDHNLFPSDFESLSDLSKLPIINKQRIRELGSSQFVANGYPKSKRILSRSSGSTGEPFSFYVSKEAYSVNMAAKLRTWYQAGYRLGDMYMKIANGPRHGWLKKVQDKVNHCSYVPFFEITDEKLDSILTLIEKVRPTIIRSYPIPLFLLSKYRLSHSDYHYCPNHIMTTGSTLPVEYRKVIESAFGCDVIDSYSCEGTANTAETPVHDGYHISKEYGFVEILDENDNPIETGIGRVISTDLWNYAQPIIRYDTQDLVEVIDGRIVKILGRECESFYSKSGKLFTMHNFVGFFQEHDRPIRETVLAYQVVLRKNGCVTFRLVVTPEFTQNMQSYIKIFWSNQFGTEVSVELVDEIPLMHNNKRMTIIKES